MVIMKENELKRYLFSLHKKLRKCRLPRVCYANDLIEACPNHRNPIQECHSISKEIVLRGIARNGNVYILDHENLDQSGINRPNYQIRQVGLRKALTFCGFCNFHDISLFSCFERRDINLDETSLASISFRSIAFEAWCLENELVRLKQGQEAIKRDFPRAYEKNTQAFEGEIAFAAEPRKKAKETLHKIATILGQQTYNAIRHCTIRFSDPPPVMGCSAFLPQFNLDGRVIWRDARYSCSREDARSRMIIMSSHRDETSYVYIFSWLRYSQGMDVPGRLFQDLAGRTGSAQRDALVRMIFWYIGRIIISPDWSDNNPKLQNFQLRALTQGRFAQNYPPAITGIGASFPQIENIQLS